MTWPRPVPNVGDRTSAAQRAADPTGWALGESVSAALDQVVTARRDVRRFRPDAVPDELLRRVLAAGHAAPSVGHSQPWRFVVVREQSSRDRAAALADTERLRQADRLSPDRRAQLLDLQLEGIREAPLGVVVACDRRTAPAGVLGRATFPDTDLWSCACAIQNIWLTARAAGLGLGWVTLFRPADLATLLQLPDGVETLGWLCLGWPDERNPEPGLQRRGWSARLDLHDVVITERWPRDDGPAPPPSHLAAPAPAAVVAARDTGDELLAAPGSLGVLDATIDRVLALPGAVPTTGTLVLAAAEHPVVRHGVSAYPASVTDDVLAATAAGESLAAVTARATGLALQWHRAVPAGAQGDLLTADALTDRDVRTLLAEGVEIGRMSATGGLVCLGEVGIGNTTVAAALACALLELTPDEVVGLGSGADTAMLQRKRAVVSGALARLRTRDLADPLTVLAALGGPEFALLAGVTLGATGAGVPVVLDGLATSVAALLAVRLQVATRAALVAGQRSRERAHGAVLTELGLEPLLDLRLRAGEGVGACLAAQALLSGLAVRRTAGPGAAVTVAGGLAAGVVLDRLAGDPRRGHPVALFGAAAQRLEGRLYRDDRAAGVLFTGICVASAGLLGRLVGRRPLVVALATWTVLGSRSLQQEAAAVRTFLDAGDLPGARQRLTHLVGRETAGLDGSGVSRAVVESVAENACDAVVAPLFWGALGGVPGLLAYRAANTLDAMVGHRSSRYERFGWASARLDDAANLVPARLTALLAAAAAPVVSGSPRTALDATRRWGRAHPSPNSGMSEAAFAGALGLRLGGRNVYQGAVDDRPVLGDGRAPVAADIDRATRLLRATTAGATGVAVVIALVRGRS